MKKTLKIILAIVITLLATAWAVPAVYGQDNDNASQAGITVQATPPPATPAVVFYGNAIGTVNTNDLFLIDAINTPMDINIELYITNSDDLIHYLRYLILKVVVYIEDSNGQWQLVTEQNGLTLPDTYITLQNGQVTFTLRGQAHYKVAIESGTYHALPTQANVTKDAPQFYLNAEPA
jgi:hypothetical protein